MKLEDLTIKEVREVLSLFGNLNQTTIANPTSDTTLKPIDSYWIGKKVIVRTFSAGIHFGEIYLKSNDEVIVNNSRRLYYWRTINNGISLSEVANYGLHDDSKVCATVPAIYLKSIELIECSDISIQNIEAKNDYTV